MSTFLRAVSNPSDLDKKIVKLSDKEQVRTHLKALQKAEREKSLEAMVQQLHKIASATDMTFDI